MAQQPTDGHVPPYPQMPSHPFAYGNPYPVMSAYPMPSPVHMNHMMPPFANTAPFTQAPALNVHGVYGQAMPPVVAPLPALATHGYAQIPPQHPIPTPPSVAPKQRPNPEPRPGGESELVVEDIEDLATYQLLVFSFQVDVSDGEARREFVAETDMTWEVFHAKVLRYLESAAGKVELTCKVSGDTGKAGQMKGEEDYRSALERVRQRAQNARTRAVSLEIKNIVSIRIGVTK